jgi:hypothetical protein
VPSLKKRLFGGGWNGDLDGHGSVEPLHHGGVRHDDGVEEVHLADGEERVTGLVGELGVHGLVASDLVPQAARAGLPVLDLLEGPGDGRRGKILVAREVAGWHGLFSETESQGQWAWLIPQNSAASNLVKKILTMEAVNHLHPNNSPLSCYCRL